MAEQTLNNPLTGNEVIEAIVDKLRDKLRKDCYLNQNSSYDWFSAKLQLDLAMHDAGSTLNTTYEVAASAGQEAKQATRVSEVLEIEKVDSPNKVRVATGQPVPTLTKDEKGNNVVKGVRYARSRAGVAAATLMLLFAVALHAQTAPELDRSDQLAVQSLNDRFKAIQDEQERAQTALAEAKKDLNLVDAAIRSHYPGYHLDVKTLTLVKNEPAKKPEAKKPEEKPAAGSATTTGPQSPATTGNNNITTDYTSGH